MKKIYIEQVQEILLDIMKETHRICKENNIPYYLIGGSMLGAVRHSGFIPWDDDMDICVPREHFFRFIDIMKTELKYPYRINTYKESDWIIAGYAKIQDCRTIVDDTSMKCKFEERPGVNIDVFPLDECSDSINWTKAKIWKVFISLKNSNFTPPNKLRAFLRRIAKIIVPLLKDKNYYIDKIEKYAMSQSGQYNFTIWGRYGKKKELISKDFFGTPALYKFCNTEFYGVEKPHEYLSHLYGDYMQVPPPEKRFVHVDNIYLK